MDGKYSFNQKKLNATVSIDPHKHMALLEVYPNPTSDYINLVYDADQSTELYIFDTSGKMVRREQIHQNGFSNHRIDVSDLSEGIYLVRMQSGNLASTMKFIKQ